MRALKGELAPHPLWRRHRWRAAVVLSVLTTGLLSPLSTRAAPEPVAAPKGFVFRIEREGDRSGRTLYLYGTLHVGRVSGPGLDPATIDLLRHCQRLGLELDPRDAAGIGQALQRYALYPAGETLAQHLPEELDQRAVAAAGAVQLPAARAEQMRPWVLANLISVLNLSRNGYDPRKSSEALLASAAGNLHVVVFEIEGADAQMKLLGGAPEATQIDALRLTLQQVDDGELASQASALLRAWERSDVAEVEHLRAELAKEPGPYPRFMDEELLGKRNQSMADSAVAQLQQPGTTFFAVGSLHLFGPAGLIALMRQRGYSVTMLSSAAP